MRVGETFVIDGFLGKDGKPTEATFEELRTRGEEAIGRLDEKHRAEAQLKLERLIKSLREGRTPNLLSLASFLDTVEGMSRAIDPLPQAALTMAQSLAHDGGAGSHPIVYEMGRIGSDLSTAKAMLQACKVGLDSVMAMETRREEERASEASKAEPS